MTDEKIKQSAFRKSRHSKTKRKGIHGKKHTVQDVRHELWVCHQKIIDWDMKNKLAERYRAKVNHMLFYMRLIPAKKNTLKNWHMPDYQDICNLENDILTRPKGHGISQDEV